MEGAFPEVAAPVRVVRLSAHFSLLKPSRRQIAIPSEPRLFVCFARGWDGPDKRRRWIAGSSKTIFAELFPLVEE